MTSPSRKAALAALVEVLSRRRPLDVAAFAALPPRDAGFARALASQTLRHFGALDAVLRHFLQKPLAPHKAGPATEILLLGAAELLILKVPPHAAVDGAVRLAADDPKARHFKPLINAVLRRVAEGGAGVLAGLDRPRVSTPDWLWARWTGHYGEPIARAIAEAHLVEAPLDIVLKTPDAPAPEGEALFGSARRLSAGGRVDEMPGFAQGGWWVQDAAATLPARLLGDVAGMRVIDLCAAPGGKTMQLAAAGALVTAVESDAGRAARIRENLARTGLAAELVLADARDYAATGPLVLLDAPCTATGTIRRHPDLPWNKGAADVTLAAAAAYEILESAASMVESGGRLVFAVCSLEAEEGEEQIARFLAAHPEFTRVRVTAEELFGHSEWLTPAGDLRTLPYHLNGMDGFYAARLRRL
jgi:16S rRNA (cytosine967-C5)-methyltransferase